MDEFIERRIVTGLIISRDYLQRVQTFWDDAMLESPELRKIARWALDHFEKYDTAPDSDIESIYMGYLKSGKVLKAEAEFIELILSRLSDEYGRGEQFNSSYLYDQSVAYFRHREVATHNEQVQSLIDIGNTEEASELAQSYAPTNFATSRGLELGSGEAKERVEHAFSEVSQHVLRYPGAAGKMLNDHFIRGGFVAFLAPEKRGKTWLLLDIGLRAIRQKANVAFFQAGDMTESQQLKRICVYLARRSDRERYCEEHWKPVGDCILNQLDLCNRGDRNCDHGIYEGVDLDEYWQARTQFESLKGLTDKAKEYPEYTPCDSAICNERKGTVWMQREPKKPILKAKQAWQELERFFGKYKRRFKLVTYPPETLSPTELRSCLDEWERQDDFVPDIVLVDYADLMTARVQEFRHRQDAIWKGLRAVSQERHCLVITATQANAASYKSGRLSLSNFSEDKRKYAHVTAMWGMNQDPLGREKKLGILRLNELVVREGEYSIDNEVHILQDLRMGRPFLESYK